jgi:hypothetical protein
MGIITIKKQSSASVPLPATDHLRLFVDDADDILKTKDDLGTVRPSGVGTADELATVGAPVDVSSSVAPVIGSVLTADSPIVATWKAPGTVLLLGSPVVQAADKVGPIIYPAVIGDLIPCDVSGGTVTVNLPTAVGNTNREIWVKLISAATNPCTINTAGIETIDGAATAVLNTDYEWIILRSDGANWMQLG